MAITLAAARVNKGLTQKEAAKMIGISLTTLQNYEKYKTKPDIDVGKKISEVYGVTIDDIRWTQ